jgi:hypothetical protein
LKAKKMYVSVTGLKPKGLIGWIRFWALTIPASKDAQKAEGIMHCAFISRHGFQHTLTVWKSKKYMLGYLKSPAHLKAMKKISEIGDGKVYGYEADTIPSWEDALTEWDKNGRMH